MAELNRGSEPAICVFAEETREKSRRWLIKKVQRKKKITPRTHGRLPLTPGLTSDPTPVIRFSLIFSNPVMSLTNAACPSRQINRRRAEEERKDGGGGREMHSLRKISSVSNN